MTEVETPQRKENGNEAGEIQKSRFPLAGATVPWTGVGKAGFPSWVSVKRKKIAKNLDNSNNNKNSSRAHFDFFLHDSHRQ